MTEEEPGTQPLRQVMDTLHITIKDWDHQRPRRCWYTGDDRVAEVTYNNQRILCPYLLCEEEKGDWEARIFAILIRDIDDITYYQHHTGMTGWAHCYSAGDGVNARRQWEAECRKIRELQDIFPPDILVQLNDVYSQVTGI